MSRFTTAIRPLAIPAAVGVIIFASAGRWELPFVWAILGALAAFYLALAAFADPGMMRERLAPGRGNQDRLTRFLGAGMLVGHWVLAGLDVGRFHWSLVEHDATAQASPSFHCSVPPLSCQSVGNRQIKADGSRK
jgi:hypothetical protein